MAENPAATLLKQAILKAISKPQPGPQPPDTSIPAAANPAIAYCLQAYTDALQASLRNDVSNYQAKEAAKAAYRSAMPPLTGSRNIRDFVACIAHAMAIEAIDGREGPAPLRRSGCRSRPKRPAPYQSEIECNYRTETPAKISNYRARNLP
jgi:hypothetical protein